MLGCGLRVKRQTLPAGMRAACLCDETLPSLSVYSSRVPLAVLFAAIGFGGATTRPDP
jgi:hypothetical protein